MKIIKILALSITLVGILDAASFDCKKASSIHEKAICANTSLDKLDSELGRLYKKARQVTTESALYKLKKTQKYWFIKRKPTCKDASVACLEKYYTKRNTELKKIIEKETVVFKKESVEDGFIQVHKEKVPVSPILMVNQMGSKPVASVPWKQKILLEMSDAEVLQVIPYRYEGEMQYLIFTHTSGIGEGYMRMYEYIHGNKKPTLVFQAKEISYSPWMYSNYIVSYGEVQFYYKSSTSDKKIYRLYSLGSGIEPKYTTLDTDSASEYEAPFYNHSGSSHIHTNCYYNNSDITALIKTDVRMGREMNLFTLKNSTDLNWLIGDISWSEDDKVIYFDNSSEMLACIWRYDLQTGRLEKIVPEHEAKYPYSYRYNGKEYIAYIENKQIKLATPVENNTKENNVKNNK